MPSKMLIINADDCNLTSKVTEAILSANETGIVTSTTFIIQPRINGSIFHEHNNEKSSFLVDLAANLSVEA